MKKLNRLIVLITLNTMLWGQEYMVLPDSGLNLRSSADKTSERLTNVPTGSIVQLIQRHHQLETIDGITDNWCKINANGREGWVFCGYLGRIMRKVTCSSVESLLPPGDAVTKSEIIDAKYETSPEPGKYVRKLTYFKSGIVVEHRSGYEYFADNYYFPEINIYEAFLIVKRCNELYSKISFPKVTKEKTIRFKQDKYMTGHAVIEKKAQGVEIRFEHYD
ncbi:SH3 domain-containing protein [Turneriella parva]|uniref:SH3 type 3 domain protein n=1 Tax=Turneriella parva (strain ATCC BAA-1111 / DSM 21527 / NCTC 11395 / H) TaxID=869212 RepID=I4B9M0_TURPD|nr:SH3 domain-containing protein [Turneriella parva]AFM13977.1 SH3 type 3 domain protein [Turneriella parva DSM 21527]